jgi:hypothetical protein
MATPFTDEECALVGLLILQVEQQAHYSPGSAVERALQQLRRRIGWSPEPLSGPPTKRDAPERDLWSRDDRD